MAGKLRIIYLAYPQNRAENSERRDRPFSLRDLIEHPLTYVGWTLLGLIVSVWAWNAMAILGWLVATCGALRLASRDGYGVLVVVRRGIARLSSRRNDPVPR